MMMVIQMVIKKIVGVQIEIEIEIAPEDGLVGTVEIELFVDENRVNAWTRCRLLAT